jgi:2-amino-4-hydroxy-6-hydroxymethyldihydropteridine diphosphokinase
MIFLSIGSNLTSKFGNRFDNISKTIDLLNQEKIKVLKVSNFFETPSYPNKKLPKFINIVAEVNFNSDPKKLIKKISKIEKLMGRVKSIKNSPRVCDIDIIDFNKNIINTKKLTLPHPSSHKRNFVLFPLKEVYSKWIHPLSNQKIDVLIKKLSIAARKEITRLKERVTLSKC